MANPPMLTPEQRQHALEKAGAARRQRAEVKDKLKIGSLTLGELFEAADRGDECGRHAREAEGRQRARVASGRRQGARAQPHVGARHLREPRLRGLGHEPATARCSRSLPADEPARRRAGASCSSSRERRARARARSARGCAAREPALRLVGVVDDAAPRRRRGRRRRLPLRHRERVRALRDAGGFLEWFEVYGDLKGTPEQFVADELAAGRRRAARGRRAGRAGGEARRCPMRSSCSCGRPRRAEQRRRLEAARARDDPRRRSSAGWPGPRPRSGSAPSSSTPSS